MPNQVLQYLDDNAPASLDRLKQWLAIPSVSTQPAMKEHMGRAAQWLADQLNGIGLDARVIPTTGHSVVLAHSRPGQVVRSDAPRVLFYGHYDVQPAEPLELWTTPPFEPSIRQGAIYARGASDDKGQVMCFVEALRAWKSVHGKLPGPVTLLIEGEEEISSPSLDAVLDQHRLELQADLAVVGDTQMLAPGKPAITYGLRGLQYFDIQLHAANRDLHSGMYGGAAPNPAILLTRVLSKLWDADHRITLPGFYDDVLPLDPREKAAWAKLNYDEKRDLLDPVGLKLSLGEKGYDSLERRWVRPCCDINGLYGGYGGPGAKTVLPAMAGAKVSFRLVPNQSPQKVARQFEDWLRAQSVPGCTWKITDLGGGDPTLMPIDSPYMAAADRAVQRSAGVPATFIREGASIPVAAVLKKRLGLDCLMPGFALADDCVHAPNEKFNLDCFQLGCRTQAVLLAELAAVPRSR